MNKKGTLLSVLLGTAAFLAALLALAVTPAAHANSTYTDPVGDSGVAPDITGVAVSNDGDIVTMNFTITGMQLTGGLEYAWADAYLDTGPGGRYDGSDVVLDITQSPSGPVLSFAHWTHGGFSEMTPSSTMKADWSGDTYTFTFGAADIGGVRSFEFYVQSYGYAWSDGGPGEYGLDWAPNETDWWTYALTEPVEPAVPATPVVPEPQQVVTGLAGIIGGSTVYVHGEDGLWHPIDSATFAALGYDGGAVQWFGELPGSVGEPVPAVVPAPVKAVPRVPESVPVVVPAIGAPATTPVRVVAGKTVKVSFPVTDQNTGSALTTATMTGNPKVNGVIVKHVEHFGNGRATITLKVPKAAKGKQLKVALTIRVADQSASELATFRIV
jgi:hypothetical protein